MSMKDEIRFLQLIREKLDVVIPQLTYETVKKKDYTTVLGLVLKAKRILESHEKQ